MTTTYNTGFEFSPDKTKGRKSSIAENERNAMSDRKADISGGRLSLTEKKERSAFYNQKNSISPEKRQLQSIQEKMAYPVKAKFGKYHIVESKLDLHCEPYAYPDKPLIHTRDINFDRSPLKVRSYKDGISLNENRFENIDKLPKIFSKSKYFFVQKSLTHI